MHLDKVAEFIRFDWFDIPILIILVWGWTRWASHRQPRGRQSILALMGFTLASASGLLAISSMLYAYVVGGFRYYDPLLLRIFVCGGLLSAAGTVFAIAGARESSALRWHAVGFSAGMLLFWFMSAPGE